MPMSEAAMDGIKANGLQWKHRINLNSLPAKIGDGDNLTAEELRTICDEIVRLGRAWTKRVGEHTAVAQSVESRLEDLEMVDEDIEEVRFVMGLLYDEFDFYRVVVER